MGNAISSLIGRSGAEVDDDGEENVLLSEEHSLVLTCCWVTLKVQEVETNICARLPLSKIVFGVHQAASWLLKLKRCLFFWR